MDESTGSCTHTMDMSHSMPHSMYSSSDGGEGGGTSDDTATSTRGPRAGVPCGCLHRWFARDGDTGADVRNKVVVWALLLLTAMVNAAGIKHWDYPSATFATVFALLAALLLVRRNLHGGFLHLVVVVYALEIAIWDLYTLAGLGRIWPLFLLVIDGLMVVGAPRHLSIVVVIFVMLHLFLCELELDTRALGLLDLPGMMPYERRRGLMQCDEPPCARARPEEIPFFLAPQYMVFLCDFLLTRAFAEQAARQHKRVAASVEAAEHIAASLAGFDLDAAGEYLVNYEGHMPRQLRASFARLLDNLASYRPYLPQSCLRDTMDADDDDLDNPAYDAVEAPSAQVAFMRVAHPQPHAASIGQPSPVCETVVSWSGTTASRCRSRGSRSDASSTGSPAEQTPQQQHLPLGRVVRSSRGSAAGMRRDQSANPTPQDLWGLRVNRLSRRDIAIVRLDLDVDAHGFGFSNDAGGSGSSLPYDDFATVHEAFLEAVVAAASLHRGVVDSFEGSTVAATVNAGRIAYGVSAKALGILKTLYDNGLGARCSGAVVAAPALVGVLGTAALRRPCVLGEAPELASRLAVFAKVARVRFVCNSLLYSDVHVVQSMRLIMDRIVMDAGVAADAPAGPGGLRLAIAYEVMLKAVKSPDSDAAREWMYEVDAAGGGDWARYNAAGRRYLLGKECVPGEEEMWSCVAAAAAAGHTWHLAPRCDPVAGSGNSATGSPRSLGMRHTPTRSLQPGSISPALGRSPDIVLRTLSQRSGSTATVSTCSFS